jgi:acyl-CoA synthetase (AMP-forming)/AMP-acid ligase II
MHPVYDRSNPMATLIDYYLDHAVHRTYLILAHPQEDDVVKISFREYARATHRFAKWLQGHVEPGRVVAFLPQADTLSELTAICGVIRAGNTVGLMCNTCYMR